MKKLLFLLPILLFSCQENSKELRSDIDNLNSKKVKLQSQVDSLYSQKFSLNSGIMSATQKYNELSTQNNILSSGKIPKYVLTLHLRQIHYSLSIKKQIADAANAIDFDIAVDKEYYDNVVVGQSIVDNFRMGSLIMKGSFGNWEMKVKNKTIE